MARAFRRASLLLFAIVLVRTAWMADDAYISLRTVDNFVSGYGLRWNVDERVQVFTHPLWLFVMSAFYAVTHEAYYAILLLSIAISIAVVVLFASKLAANAAVAAVGVLLFTLSKSFMDYSTSGLENPLTHLLLAAFFVVYLRDDRPDAFGLFVLSALSGCLALDRLDTLLLVAPALGLRLYRGGIRGAWRPLALGFLPFALWEGFSLLYFGVPLPNTAYAKLGGDVPQFERVVQGFVYLIDSVSMDPVTLVVIALAMIVPVVLRDRVAWPLAAGLALSLVYVIQIGGDFMSGRMLSATFFVAVVVLARRSWEGDPRLAAMPVAACLLLGLGATDPGLLTGRSFKHDGNDRDGIVDERRVYYHWTGLLNAVHNAGPMDHPWAAEARRVLSNGTRVSVYGANGFFGYAVRRDLHVVDKFALGDALLARLPSEPGWYTGHLPRRLPAGYVETLESGRNVIEEPGIAALYERMKLVTRAPLFSRHRLHAIWRLNTDGYRDLLKGTTYDIAEVAAAQLHRRTASEMSNADEPLHVRERGTMIIFEQALHDAPIDVMSDANDDFIVIFQRGSTVVTRRIVHRLWVGEPSGLHTFTIAPPSRGREFDRVLIRPRRAWGPLNLYYVGPHS